MRLYWDPPFGAAWSRRLIPSKINVPLSWSAVENFPQKDTPRTLVRLSRLWSRRCVRRTALRKERKLCSSSPSFKPTKPGNPIQMNQVRKRKEGKKRGSGSKATAASSPGPCVLLPHTTREVGGGRCPPCVFSTRKSSPVTSASPLNKTLQQAPIITGRKDCS